MLVRMLLPHPCAACGEQVQEQLAEVQREVADGQEQRDRLARDLVSFPLTHHQPA